MKQARILSVVRRWYYGRSGALEPLHLYFTKPLQDLGCEVTTFDHFAISARFGKDRATAMLLDLLARGEFSLMLYQSAGIHEPIDTGALRGIAGKTCTMCWNSDDDWQWENWTSQLTRDFSYVVTTYRKVFETARQIHSNVLLSQWACYEKLGGPAAVQDIAFSFVGGAYRHRNGECRYLSNAAGLRVFGRGSRLVRLGLPFFRGVFHIPFLAGEALSFEQTNAVWARSRVSFTPLRGAHPGVNGGLQIKGRVFEMGNTGTLMLCDQNPALEEFYEPGKEFVAYHDLVDCAEKAKFFTFHEDARRKIALRYRERTLRDHLWRYRMQALLKVAGIRAAESVSAGAAAIC
jgi:hypothetical protein